MADSIFVIGEGATLHTLEAQAYDSEELLQRLLADHPEVLAGAQIDPEAPRRWLLVSREMPVPGEEGGSGRWSLDHLLLDQDGIPTLVEVKRGTDGRIRREVVGQMLEYAANAVLYWPMEEIRARFSKRFNEPGQAEAAVAEFVGSETDPDAFWATVKTNMQAGKVRMLFVADEIPPELKRIVEFLNGQMDPAEVLAVELKQYVGPQLRTLVPRVFGLTAEAGGKKTPGRRIWDEASFMEDTTQRLGPEGSAVATSLLSWCAERKLPVTWGHGKTQGSFSPQIYVDGLRCALFWVYGSGSVEIGFKSLKETPAFAPQSERDELLRRLREIPGVKIADSAVNLRPNLPFSLFAKPDACTRLKSIFDWALSRIHATKAEADVESTAA